MKNYLIIFITILSIVLLTACSLEKPGKNNEKSNSSGVEEVTIGFAVSTLNNPFFVNLRDGVEEAADKKEFKTVITDAQDDSSQQVNDIEDLIQQDVDVLLVNPTDDVGVVAGIEAANDAGIPVVTVDREAEEGKVEAHVESDNVLGGEMAGEYIVDKLDKEGNIIELEGIAGVLGTRQRGEGFHNIIDDEKKLDVIASQNADYDRTKGLTVMENILQSNEDIDAVFAHNDEMALGAAEALESKDLLDDVIVVGFDATDDAKEAVENGEMSATIEQQPKLMGEDAIDTIEKILKGDEVDDVIPVDLKLFTK